MLVALSKISNIFFYLSCKSGTTYFHQTNLPMMTMETDKTKLVTGLRPNRFRRNTKAKQRFISAEPDPIAMFEVLVDISKGYVQLNNLIQPPS